ncbi:hypothetical protein F2Q70_00026835 [Brassica cretica]|uniref:FHA domain-containing protein n=1 Tax=Brassica cretica TaxID=69181 RepID=A0A8S9L1S9_BRACR|nr:hypothetical protein F2Q70_00026835 [Brassica cretica]
MVTVAKPLNLTILVPELDNTSFLAHPRLNMGALAQVVPWIPEDDLLLKNAIEAGASLESLAKGAVQFSRRLSIRELQDRWHALLYDPVVSAEAAFRMAELERTTNPNFPTKFARTGQRENKGSSRKRKAEQLRSTYHSLRKKFQAESFSSLDLGFLGQANDSHFMDNGDATHLGLEDSHMDIIHNAFPDILADHVVSEDHLQGDISYVEGGDLTFTDHADPSECDAVHQDSKQKLEISAHAPKAIMASTDCFLEQLSTSLFEEEEPLMEVDGKEVDKSYYDGLSSLLVNPTNDTNSRALPISSGQDPSRSHVMPELHGTSSARSIKCKPVPNSAALDPHPEIVGGVLVGRSTEDLAVDIDLGREKRGSKISRRQAIIRLGDDGSFHIKNLGKYSISVNEKEVEPGQSLILKSDCLLEIRGMPFVFETNQSRMKEYMKKRTGKGN